MSTAEVKQQFQITRDGLRTLKEKNTGARQAMESGDQAIRNEINLINEKISQVKALVARSNEIDSALKFKEDEVKNLQKELEETKAEFTTTRGEKEALENSIKEKEDEIARINALMAANLEESRAKDANIEKLQGEIMAQRATLEQVNGDLQEILAEATQLNADLASANGEVDQLNEYNNTIITNINTLLKKVNVDLQDILNMPPPSASEMSKIHQERMTKAAAAPDDGLGDGLGDMFAEKHENTLGEEALHAEREERRRAASEDIDLSETNLFDQPEQKPQEPQQLEMQPESVDLGGPTTVSENAVDTDTTAIPAEETLVEQQPESSVRGNFKSMMFPSEIKEYDDPDTPQDRKQELYEIANRRMREIAGNADVVADSPPVVSRRVPPPPPPTAESSISSFPTRKKSIFLPGSKNEFMNGLTAEEQDAYNKSTDEEEKNTLMAKGLAELVSKQRKGGRRTRKKRGRGHCMSRGGKKRRTKKHGGYIAVKPRSSRKSKSSSSSSSSKKTRKSKK